MRLLDVLKYELILESYLTLLMSKLCIVYNIASHYREAIFRLIDREYDCDWYFGANTTHIKGMDLSVLEHVTTVHNKTVIHSPLYYQKGIVALLFKKQYPVYLILGELYCLSTWLFIVLRKLFYPRKRVYFWSHAWYGREGALKVLLKKVFFGLVDGTFVYGDYARDLMIKHDFDGKKLFVIHNSLAYDKQLAIRQCLKQSDIYQRHFGNDAPTLIFIGRLTEEKRIDWLIEALAIMKTRNRICNLIVVGAGEAEQQLKMLAANQGLSGQVWFYGACYDEEKNAELIYNADLCVSPGNVGLTAVHSMMFGTPVITHDTFKYQGPEFEAIHPGVTGAFFEYGKPESIVACVMDWLTQHGEMREEVRKECYEEIDNYWNPVYQINVIKQNLLI